MEEQDYSDLKQFFSRWVKEGARYNSNSYDDYSGLYGDTSTKIDVEALARRAEAQRKLERDTVFLTRILRYAGVSSRDKLTRGDLHNAIRKGVADKFFTNTTLAIRKVRDFFPEIQIITPKKPTAAPKMRAGSYYKHVSSGIIYKILSHVTSPREDVFGVFEWRTICRAVRSLGRKNNDLQLERYDFNESSYEEFRLMRNSAANEAAIASAFSRHPRTTLFYEM